MYRYFVETFDFAYKLEEFLNEEKIPRSDIVSITPIHYGGNIMLVYIGESERGYDDGWMDC